jgi:hypothetical protein
MANKDKVYFLFGEYVTDVLENDGLKAALEAAKIEVWSTYVWDEDSTPQELLAEAYGWEGWMEITEEQYNAFQNPEKSL